MDFNVLREELSSLGIDRQIFEIELNSEKVFYRDHSVIKYERHQENNCYIAEYEYKQNPIENWESVTLFIRKQIVTEFIGELNKILKKYELDAIGIKEITKGFEYKNNGLLFLIVFSKDSQLQIEIARRKT